MTNANDNKRDLSLVTGGSARKIYETTQELIKTDKLAPEMSITRTNQFHAPFDFLYVQEGFNIREGLNEEKIRMFAELFKAGKYVPPIEVIAVAGRFQVLDGHHRYYGAELAIKEGATIARITLSIFDGDQNEAILRMINSAEGERLTPLEKAGAYQRLRNQGMTVEEIAAARCQSALQISKVLRLATAPIRVKQVVREGLMSATAVIDILIDCEKTGADASVMVDQALANAASSGKARATAKHVKGSSTPKAKPLPRKHVDSAIGTLLNSNFADQLRSALPAEAADGESGEVEVKIPASMGRDLLAALEELFKAKAAQESPEGNAESEAKE